MELPLRSAALMAVSVFECADPQGTTSTSAGACTSLRWRPGSTGETFLFGGYSIGRLSSFFLLNGAVMKVSAVSLGVGMKSVEYSSQHLLVTCVVGCVRWLSLVGALLEKEPPTLWNSMHGDNSVSIGCCSIKRRC